jgi:osmotically inducible lipoprotein OsmB
MRKSLILFALLTLPLAGCLQDPASRGLAGAAAGAVIADATENDLVTGALIGGLAGAATCGIEVGLPPCAPRY